MSFVEKMNVDIEQLLNGDGYDDIVIDRLFKLTTIRANLATFEQKEAMGNIFEGLMEKMKDLDINELVKNNPNFRGF